jgi:hypothetical protein
VGALNTTSDCNLIRIYEHKYLVRGVNIYYPVFEYKYMIQADNKFSYRAFGSKDK